MSPLVRNLQRILRPLELTPLHPQWLVLRHRQETGAWVKAHARGRLLDIGCGNGRLRHELGDGVDYIGIDYPTTVALGYVPTADILADAARLPVATASVDVVTLLDVLEHLPAPERALAEAARVLRTGGRCLIHVPFLYPLHDEPHDFQRWTRHGLERLLAAHGFEVVELRETTSPLEAAAALLTMAIAAALVGQPRGLPLRLLLAPLVVVLIVAINLLGWIGTMLPHASPFMSFSYRVLALRAAGSPDGASVPAGSART